MLRHVAGKLVDLPLVSCTTRMPAVPVQEHAFTPEYVPAGQVVHLSPLQGFMASLRYVPAGQSVRRDNLPRAVIMHMLLASSCAAPLALLPRVPRTAPGRRVQAKVAFLVIAFDAAGVSAAAQTAEALCRRFTHLSRQTGRRTSVPNNSYIQRSVHGPTPGNTVSTTSRMASRAAVAAADRRAMASSCRLGKAGGRAAE